MRFAQFFKEDDDGFPVVTMGDDAILSEAELAEIIDVCPTGSIHRAGDATSEARRPQ